MTMTDLIMAGAPRSTMAARLVSLCWRPNVECYYFGYAPMGGRDTNVPRQFDCMRLASALGRNIDGGLCCWLDTQTEGQALLTHGGGWTAIAFWDRSSSGGARPYSNTAFIVRGTLTFEQMIRVQPHR